MEADFDGVTVRVNSWLENPLEQFVFADGSELDRNAFDAFLDYAPVQNQPVEMTAPAIDQLFGYQIPADLFVDPITGEDLTYRVSINGSSGWLSYDSSTRTLSGTPAYSDIGSVPIEITARDSSFQEASTLHTLDVLPPVDGYAVLHPDTIDGRNGTHLTLFGYSDDPQGATESPVPCNWRYFRGWH
ncbi:MAG: putative Ig domain-containing protein [Gammaproteobacteria bacterium]|nr:putative Ig domain-containing protein [Gammaproteobacteria bacterium]